MQYMYRYRPVVLSVQVIVSDCWLNSSRVAEAWSARCDVIVTQLCRAEIGFFSWKRRWLA
jgi:hypothetical protein